MHKYPVTVIGYDEETYSYKVQLVNNFMIPDKLHSFLQWVNKYTTTQTKSYINEPDQLYIVIHNPANSNPTLSIGCVTWQISTDECTDVLKFTNSYPYSRRITMQTVKRNIRQAYKQKIEEANKHYKQTSITNKQALQTNNDWAHDTMDDDGSVRKLKD